MLYRKSALYVGISLLFASLLFLNNGCGGGSSKGKCVGNTSYGETKVQTNGRPCAGASDTCSCNNQVSEGYCETNETCISIARSKCEKEDHGKSRSCDVPQLLQGRYGYNKGTQICKDEGLKEFYWGDCKKAGKDGAEPTSPEPAVEKSAEPGPSKEEGKPDSLEAKEEKQPGREPGNEPGNEPESEPQVDRSDAGMTEPEQPDNPVEDRTNTEQSQSECKVGETASCYPTSQVGCIYNAQTRQWDCKGVCKVGTKTCQSNLTWGPCQNSEGPTAETCNGKDNNCDGQIDPMVNCVSTYAGSGVQGNGDGPALQAQFDSPVVVKMGPKGNLYVLEKGKHHIRRVTPNGQVETFAGSRSPGFKEGARLTALFDEPKALVFDAVGNLYVADQNNNRIRKIDASGQVTTYVGTGTCTSIGGGDCRKNGPRLQATIRYPQALAVDSLGQLYFSGSPNKTPFRIRKVDTKGYVTDYIDRTNKPLEGNLTVDLVGTLSYLAGYIFETFPLDGKPVTPNTTAPCCNRAIAVDNWGGTYLALQTKNPTGYSIYHLDRKYNATLLAGTKSCNPTQGCFKDGPGLQAQFYGPTGLDVDKDGTIYVADTLNHRIRKITHLPEKCATPGQQRACFTGPASARKKGICKDGVQDCKNGYWTLCKGQILPTMESCRGSDENCDGLIDNTSTCTHAFSVDRWTLGLWRFNAGKGSSEPDASTNSNTATLKGNPVPSWVKGRFGSALQFDGKQNYVDSGYTLKQTTASSFTIEAIFQIKSLPASNKTTTIIGSGTGGGSSNKAGVRIAIEDSGAVHFYVRTKSSKAAKITSIQKLVVGKWYYVAAVYGKKKLTLYINGKQEISDTLVSSTDDIHCETTLHIGSYTAYDPTSCPNGCPLWFFDGTIDSIRVSTRALEAWDIARVGNKL